MWGDRVRADRLCHIPQVNSGQPFLQSCHREQTAHAPATILLPNSAPHLGTNRDGGTGATPVSKTLGDRQ